MGEEIFSTDHLFFINKDGEAFKFDGISEASITTGDESSDYDILNADGNLIPYAELRDSASFSLTFKPTRAAEKFFRNLINRHSRTVRRWKQQKEKNRRSSLKQRTKQ